MTAEDHSFMKRRIVVGIQGIKGSFHHEAASIYFEGLDYHLMEYSSFRELATSLSHSSIDFGVMAIENTIAGSILTNYNLLSEYDLKIVGEIYLPISHHLMANPGQKIEKIREIYSHSMALLQCESFIDKHPFRVYESSDTASAAKYIYQNKIQGVAAIASANAAKEYKLDILSKNVQTIKKNFTRFFILKNKNFLCEEKNNVFFNKASLKIRVLHTSGSLSKLLSFIANLEINMTKIQSIPIIHCPWEYVFYVDLIFSKINNYRKMKKKIREFPDLHHLSIMGEYQNGISDPKNNGKRV